MRLVDHSAKPRQIDSRARYNDRRFYHRQVVLPLPLSVRKCLQGRRPPKWRPA
jgi:hypothetical protein